MKIITYTISTDALKLSDDIKSLIAENPNNAKKTGASTALPFLLSIILNL